MAKKVKLYQQVKSKVVEILKENPNGLYYMDLMRKTQEKLPKVQFNTIRRNFGIFLEQEPDKIYKPARGLYRLSSKEEAEETAEETPSAYKEEDFYEPFANYLEEMDECTKALSLGGNYLGKKWGTPDVIGVYKPLQIDPIKFHPEIISAEVKINPSEPITAFGQAIAYRLFSSKVYLVEPKTIIPEDLNRIEALCILFGVGLILFDLNPEEPNFTIRTRAQRYSPDMWYVNSFLHKLDNNKKTKNMFNKLMYEEKYEAK